MSTVESLETAELAAYEEKPFEEFEPEDSHAMPWKLWAFLAIPFLEVVAQGV